MPGPRACLSLSSPQVPAPRVGTEDAERRREWPGCGLQDCGGPEVNGPLRGLPVKPSGSSAAPGTQTEVQDELSPGPEASLLPSGAWFLELRGRAACPHPGTLTPSWGRYHQARGGPRGAGGRVARCPHGPLGGGWGCRPEATVGAPQEPEEPPSLAHPARRGRRCQGQPGQPPAGLDTPDARLLLLLCGPESRCRAGLFKHQIR